MIVCQEVRSSFGGMIAFCFCHILFVRFLFFSVFHTIFEMV